MKNEHLVIASGGTGGHFYPTLAVAKEYLRVHPSGKATLLVSGKHSSEQKKIANEAGIAAVEVPSERFPGMGPKAILFGFKLVYCVIRSVFVLNALKPSVFLGMGSFAAVPGCIAAWLLRIPLVLHEGNSFMGQANRLFRRGAKAIGLSLPLADERQLKGIRGVRVGMPLRDSIIQAAGEPSCLPEGYLEQLGLTVGNKKTILVFGGSQGAQAINQLVSEAVPLLKDVADCLQFIHLTGTDGNDALRGCYAAAGITASVRRAEPEIEKCYLSSDLVICRSGASSICELALFGKPVILIPLPSAAENHQMINATVLNKAQAACLLPQPTLTAEALASTIRDFLAQEERWRTMGENIKAFGKPDAAAALVQLIDESSR